MPHYNVDPEQISNASIAVNNSIDSIRSAVTTMYTHLTELESVWQGSAATQFSSVMQQWRASQNNMEVTLQSIQHSLSQAASTYADAEMHASQLFAQ